MKTSSLRLRSLRQRGASLLEVLVAVTIFALGILGLLGMNATALSFFSDAKYRTDAAMLADRLINQVWVDRVNISSYAYASGTGGTAVTSWATDVRNTLPAGNATVVVTGSQVQVTVTWQPPNSTQARQHTAIALIQEP